MLFPDEIFKMILKYHKMFSIRKRLNNLLQHRIKHEYKKCSVYRYQIKKLRIQSFGIIYHRNNINYTVNNILSIHYAWKHDSKNYWSYIYNDLN